jgi:hypothetical protein
MRTKVYTLLCETGSSSSVFAVYAERDSAMSHALDLAAAHAANLRGEDEATFRTSVAPDLYQLKIDNFESRSTVSVIHRFLDERGSSRRWTVQEHELVASCATRHRGFADAS